MSRVLILIDLQNDYFPSGRMELVGANAAVDQAATLLAAFREQSLPVIHVQHVANRPGASFFLPGTYGADIHSAVKPLDGEQVVIKHFPNSFRGTDLHASLKALEAPDLIVAGMMTHMCIDTTVRAAADLGFSCFLAHDACATKDLAFGASTALAADVQTAYLAALNGSFATIRSASELSSVVRSNYSFKPKPLGASA
jgi:nicotinamidase-related amidase